MHALMATPALVILRKMAGAVAVAVVGIAAGLVSGRLPEFALPLAVLVLLVAVASINLAYILVIAFVASFFLNKVGPMSPADYALTGATLVALLMLRAKGAQSLQPLLWAGTFYLALTLPQLLLNRFAGNYLEWAHEVVQVLGSMIVGFVIGRENKGRLALSAFVLACCALGVGAISSNLSGGDGYVGAWHKNAVGVFLMYGAIIAFANPPWMRWRPVWAYAAFAVCCAGMLSSRQAIVGTLIGILVVGMRPRHHNGKRSRWMLLVLIPAAWAVYAQVAEQLASENAFNSASQRLSWYVQSIGIWLTSPLYGNGNRWWVNTGGFQPPNAELEVLTTTGVIGLIGFIGMFGGAIWLLMKMNPVYGTVGLAVFVGRFTQAQFDLYWVAAEASILWIVAGICYGVREHDRAERVVWTPHPVQAVWRRTRRVRARG
nr:O-antigen ligase family protein [Microbacterium bovistercoris]